MLCLFSVENPAAFFKAAQKKPTKQQRKTHNKKNILSNISPQKTGRKVPFPSKCSVHEEEKCHLVSRSPISFQISIFLFCLLTHIFPLAITYPELMHAGGRHTDTALPPSTERPLEGNMLLSIQIDPPTCALCFSLIFTSFSINFCLWLVSSCNRFSRSSRRRFSSSRARFLASISRS